MMTEPKGGLVLVHRAASMIERDAVLNELDQHGIVASTAPRDMSRKVTESTVDLALEGYSAVFDGFPIFVSDEDRENAKKEIERFLTRIREKEFSSESVSEKKTEHLNKFYFCAIYSLLFPFLFHVYGIFHLWRGLKKGEAVRWVYFVTSILLYLFSGSIVVYYVKDRIFPF